MKRVLKCLSRFLVLLIVFSLIFWYNKINRAYNASIPNGIPYKMEQEDNNSFSTANTVNAKNLVIGRIYQTTNSVQDKDYFKIYLNLGEVVSISFINAHQNVNYNIYLYNPSQSLVASSTNSTGKNEFIQYTVSSSGYYYILVSSSYGHSGSEYYYLQVMKTLYDTGNTNTSYNRNKAVNWAKDNANFKETYVCNGITFANFYNLGGDCTNFASITLYAGGISMIYSSATGIESNTNYWFYRTSSNRSTSWSGAEFFKRHWDNSSSKRAYQIRIYPVWYAYENFNSVVLGFLKEGDIVQHIDYDSDTFKDWVSYHSQIIVSKTSNDLLYAQHSVDQSGFYYGGSLKNYLNYRDPNIGWVILYRISAN